MCLGLSIIFSLHIMDKKKCNILITGTIASGSSALKDMLREYDNINVIPGEFDYYRAPGLVGDQLSKDSETDYPDAIDEIIGMRSIRSRLIYKSQLWKLICKILPKNYWNQKSADSRLQYLKVYLLHLNYIDLLEKLHDKLKSDITYEEKIIHANQWITSVGNTCSFERDYTLFDQPILPWSDINIWPEVFSPFKMICVHRDPKDQLAEMIKRGILYAPFRCPYLNFGQVNIMSIYGSNRAGMMHFLKEAMKKRLEKIDLVENVIGPEKFLLLDFEGLVKDYDNYKTVIEEFLGVSPEKHRFRKKYFNPDVALERSIGIFKDYLSKEDLDDLVELEEWYNNKIKNRSYR